MINILLTDDHPIIRAGLKRFILDYIAHSVIDEADDGDSAFKKIKEKNYNLIILDANMPNTDSFGLVTNIIALKPGANILIYSMNAEETYAKRYLQLGAKGFLSKTSAEDEMKKALDNVMSGKKYVSSRLSESFTEAAIGKKTTNPFETLSPREFEIMLHLIRGKSISEICSTLNLQPSTAATYKARIFLKLKCDNIIDMHELAKVYNIIPLA
jgi:DNA-binding NarL/FixJ family response regulator